MHGYVTGSLVAQQARPDKRIYEPTPHGRDALQHWLDASTVDDEGPRVAYLVKFFFGRGMRRPSVAVLLDEVGAKTQRDLDALAYVHDQLNDRRLLFQRHTARHGVLMKAARLRWIAEAREALGLPMSEPR